MRKKSTLPRWAKDRIAWLEAELLRWQGLYVDLAREHPPFPSAGPTVPDGMAPWIPSPYPPDPAPGVYSYAAPFPGGRYDGRPPWEPAIGTTITSVCPNACPPTGREP
jgi:hypothetical protein